MKGPRLTIVPVTWREARAFVDQHHRHHLSPVGFKWAVGVVDADGMLRGVAICGRPVARSFDDGMTVEVNRTATDGCQNANSALYGACWRIATAMGYRRIVTYNQKGESGTSLRAANFILVRALPARGSWVDCSKSLKHIRSKTGAGGVERNLWQRELAL
jgi:hypothetical protein